VIDKFRHPWPHDTYFFFVVVNNKKVVRQIEKLQASFDFPGLVPVLPDELHITVLPVAFEGQILEAQLREISEDAARAVSEAARETVTLGPVVVDDDQVVLLANPCHTLHRVHRTLRTSLLNRLRHEVMPIEDDFRPHVSMFYSIGEHPTEPVQRVASAINSSHSRGKMGMDINALSLVKVFRSMGHYRHTVVESFQFGKAARTIT